MQTFAGLLCFVTLLASTSLAAPTGKDALCSQHEPCVRTNNAVDHGAGHALTTPQMQEIARPALASIHLRSEKDKDGEKKEKREEWWSGKDWYHAMMNGLKKWIDGVFHH